MKKACSIFSHPDFTVGSGITPDQSLSLLISESRALDTLDTTCVITAGQEFHLALKMLRYEIKIKMPEEKTYPQGIEKQAFFQPFFCKKQLKRPFQIPSPIRTLPSALDFHQVSLYRSS